MKIMARHSNLTSHESTSHESTSNTQPSATSSETPRIDASLKRRARLLITNSSIPNQTRNLIQYALEIKDPDLAQLVRRVESGEMRIDYLHTD
jgi:hypothetical protein